MEVPSSGGSLNLRVGDFIARKDVSLKVSSCLDVPLAPSAFSPFLSLPLTTPFVFAVAGQYNTVARASLTFCLWQSLQCW